MAGIDVLIVVGIIYLIAKFTIKSKGVLKAILVTSFFLFLSLKLYITDQYLVNVKNPQRYIINGKNGKDYLTPTMRKTVYPLLNSSFTLFYPIWNPLLRTHMKERMLKYPNYPQEVEKREIYKICNDLNDNHIVDCYHEINSTVTGRNANYDLFLKHYPRIVNALDEKSEHYCHLHKRISSSLRLIAQKTKQEDYYDKADTLLEISCQKECMNSCLAYVRTLTQFAENRNLFFYLHHKIINYYSNRCKIFKEDRRQVKYFNDCYDKRAQILTAQNYIENHLYKNKGFLKEENIKFKKGITKYQKLQIIYNKLDLNIDLTLK